MEKILPPYKNCRLYDVTQIFWNPQPDETHHTGVDFAPNGAYGKILVAPERVKILKVISEIKFSADFYKDLQRGFGLTMQSIADPNIVYLYWHCMQVIPVKEGQICEQGEMVAQIGNSGYCLTNGVYVPLADRNSGKGAHLHYERRDATKDPDYTDILPLIDFSLQVNLSWNQTIQQTIQQIENMLANRK